MNQKNDNKLTNDRMKTYESEEKLGTFKVAAKIEEFGAKQNFANQILAENVIDLVKRVCALEESALSGDKKIKEYEEPLQRCEHKIQVYEKRFQKIAEELTNLKTEIDRMRLTAKLNSSAIQRLDSSISNIMMNAEAYKTDDEAFGEAEISYDDAPSEPLEPIDEELELTVDTVADTSVETTAADAMASEFAFAVEQVQEFGEDEDEEE